MKRGIEIGFPSEDATIGIYQPQETSASLIKVRVTAQLRDYTGGRGELQVAKASDVLGVIKELDRSFPGIGQRVLTDQERIREFVNVFVNGDNTRDSEGERTKLNDGDVVHILPSVAGG